MKFILSLLLVGFLTACDTKSSNQSDVRYPVVTKKTLANGDLYTLREYENGTWKSSTIHTNNTVTFAYSDNWTGPKYGNEKSY